MVTSFSTPSVDQLHSQFLTILPRLELHARFAFRYVRCPHTKADKIAETIALCWKWFRRLGQKGKDATRFVTTLALRASQAVKNHRRLTGQLKPKDVMSERAQQRKGFVVGKLPDFSTLSSNPLVEALTDNTQSPVPDQVQFRCDFPAWLTTHSDRNRRIVVEMARGEGTQVLASRFKLAIATVSQMRRRFHDSWVQFTDDRVSA